jgi:D-glycero-alpha-D-manno-heptose-7-phosphate kinase
MLITRTPLRISFVGGGSDFGDYYRSHGGAVLCSAIDKYVHVILQSRYDDNIRIGYSTTELCSDLSEVRHELVRESMRLVGIEKGIEISTMADVPSTGSGLGSSSSVTVGLLNALYAHAGRPQTKETLARDAVRIEVDVLGKPIGKQDQYIAAYGGIRKLSFEPDETVRVVDVPVAAQTLRALDDNLMLFYTGVARKASTVLTEQRARVEANTDDLKDMVGMVEEMEGLLGRGELDEFGKALDGGWTLKKRLAPNISNAGIDELYDSARKAGALGGKITGAGGGGFLLLYCERSRQNAVRRTLTGLRELVFRLEPEGSKILFST